MTHMSAFFRGWSLQGLILTVAMATTIGCSSGSGSNDDGGAEEDGGAGQGGNAGTQSGGTGGQTGGDGGMAGQAQGGQGGDAGAHGGDGGAGGDSGGTGGNDAPDAGVDAAPMPDPDGGTPDTATEEDAATTDTAVEPDVLPGCQQPGDPCTLMNGDDGLCAVDATCVGCVDQDDDDDCAAAYGSGSICLGSKCVLGACHDSSDCQDGKICGIVTANACDDCASDDECTDDDAYGAGYICAGQGCVLGDCHDSSECPGTVCGAATPYNCDPCTADDQCQDDPEYGTGTMCFSTEDEDDTGKCISNTCTVEHAPCAENTSNFCCDGACTAGNCCDDSDCLNNDDFGPEYTCHANRCTECDPVSGNAYVVNPLAGNDTMASGSGQADGGTAAACAFRTVTAALQAIGTTPAPGTTVTIVGQDGQVTDLYVTKVGDDEPESFPLIVRAGVTVKTVGGAINVAVPAGKVGFILLGHGADLTGAAGAPLHIDGSGHTAIGGIEMSNAGSDSLVHHVQIKDTLGDGIRMTAGRLAIGPGVVVTDAGKTDAQASGLHASGGAVEISVGDGEDATIFESNTLHGIRISGMARLNVNGVPTAPPDGTGTVVARDNRSDNLLFQQTPLAVTTGSTVNGMVLWSSVTGHGMRIGGGSRIKLRGSVVAGNAGNGIRVTRAVNSDPGRDLTNINLGTDEDPGQNLLQAAVGQNPNLHAGLCVDLDTMAGEHTLSAQGNVFRAVDCSLDEPDTIDHAESCASYTDVGIEDRMGSMVTVDTANCE